VAQVLPMSEMPSAWIVRLTTDDYGSREVSIVASSTIDEPQPKSVVVILSMHDEIASFWCASVGFPSMDTNGMWRSRLALAGRSPRLVEVTAVLLGDDQSISVPIAPGTALQLEPTEAGQWLTGPVADEKLDQLRSSRERALSTTLEAPDTSPMFGHEFSAVLLVDNVKLTTTHRVPGMTLAPLRNSTIGSDLVMVLNDVLPGLGYPLKLDHTYWLDTLVRENNPSAVIHVPSARANTPSEAMDYVARLANQLLDLTALRRGARPRLLAGLVIGAQQEYGSRSVFPWLESGRYEGNLAGGFTSGEDPHHLIQLWNDTQLNPRTQLWLSMHADALLDPRPDYRFFRQFNLLEAIASEVFPMEEDVLDNSGNPLLMSSGRHYTTAHARGRIYALLQRVGRVTSSDIDSMATANYAATGNEIEPFTHSPGNLWNETGEWTAVRNIVAHEGTLRRPAGTIPNERRSRLEARVAQHSHDGAGFLDGFWMMGLTLRRACETVLYAAAAGKL